MEHQAAEDRPSILIVEPDTGVCAVLEEFFNRLGWQLQTWTGADQACAWQRRDPFDLVIADSLSLSWKAWPQLSELQKKKRDAALVLLVTPGSIGHEVKQEQQLLCCIEKDPVQESIRSSLECFVGEFERVKREGRLALRPRTPIEAQITIESFSSKELAINSFPFPVLTQLFEAGLLPLADKLKLQLALQEALANSLEHGNLELRSEWKEEVNREGIDRFAQVKLERLADDTYAERIVTIVSDFDCERLLIRITDQGKGFPFAERENARVNSNEPAVFGRGMAIIRSAVDQVTYALDGRQISLMKKITSTGSY